MGFVKTPEEIARIQATLANPCFTDAQVLTIDYHTDPEIVERLMPPGIEPIDEAIASVRVGRWKSNCVGDFNGGAIYLKAQRDGHEGDYVLGMWMNTDAAVIIGREVFGEPKKLGEVFLTATARGVSGWVERYGTRLLSLDAEFTDDLGPGQATGYQFCYKAVPAADGSGLEDDALLTESTYERKFRVRKLGTGTVTLRGTPHDPVDEVVVREVKQAVYVEGDFSSWGRTVERIPGDKFLPYALGRSDDYSLMVSE